MTWRTVTNKTSKERSMPSTTVIVERSPPSRRSNGVGNVKPRPSTIVVGTLPTVPLNVNNVIGPLIVDSVVDVVQTTLKATL